MHLPLELISWTRSVRGSATGLPHPLKQQLHLPRCVKGNHKEQVDCNGQLKFTNKVSDY